MFHIGIVTHYACLNTGSRHHKKAHGNSNKKTCTCCSWNGNDKSITKQKGCLKIKQQGQYQTNEELQEVYGAESHYATWSACAGEISDVPRNNVELYNKQLSDYISNKLFVRNQQGEAMPSRSNSCFPSEDKGSEVTSRTSSDEDGDCENCDDDWEMVSLDSIISL